MSKQLDKILGSRITTFALIGAVVAAAVFVSGRGALFGGGEETAKLQPARTAAFVDASPASEDVKPAATLTAANLSEAAAAPAEAAKPAPNEPDVEKADADPAPIVVVTAVDAPNSASDETRSASQPSQTVLAAAASEPTGANSFNRLLKKPSSAPNAPPARDGIHDPSNPGTGLLQWPSAAFDGLPKTSDGNKVDWVKALEQEKIAPRYKVDDPNAEPFLLDLVIIRQVKGSMPNVVYPHLQHTQWLDCSNCHDEIFTPQKGANQISMAGILLGRKCGVCHGKVAFPVSDCRRCHAQPKTAEELSALADRSSWATENK
ncbi:MAG: c(7)-type cytochrome triheme domain-containing protein [Parvularculaceae bacterium]